MTTRPRRSSIDGQRVGAARSLAQIRHHAQGQLARLPEPLRQLQPFRYPVEISSSLRSLAAELDRKEQAAFG